MLYKVLCGMYINLKSTYQYNFCVKSKPCVLSHTKIDTKYMSNKHYVVVVILIGLQNDNRKEKARNWLYGRCCFVGLCETNNSMFCT